jgi:diguanylate cyclase (GGDEF)-like protein/PAS domain S-box-containing protein
MSCSTRSRSGAGRSLRRTEPERSRRAASNNGLTGQHSPVWVSRLVASPTDVSSVSQSAEATGARSTHPDRLAQVIAMLEAAPSARVLAGARDTQPVPVPEEIPVPRDRCLPPHALDSVDPNDFGHLIEALDECRQSGYGCAEVRFLIADTEPVTIHIFETSELYGVRLCVLTVQDATSKFLDRLSDRQTAAPRLRMSQDRYGTIIDVDEALERLLGYRSREMVGNRSSDYIHPEDMAVGYGNWVELLNDPGQPRLQRMRYRSNNGQYHWFDITFTNRLDAEGFIVCACVDVSADVEAQQRVAERERLLHRLTESLPLGIVQIDAEGRVCHANDRLDVVLGFRLETDICELAECVDTDQRATLEGAVTAVLCGEDVDVQVLINPPRNRPRVCQVNLRCLTEDDGPVGALICFTEVTEAVRLQQELERQATHDALSGCLNRPAIMAFLAEQLKADASKPEGPAAVFVDLDRFKSANDLYGHAIGDEILAAVGGRLRNILRPGDAAGRLGGDEFLVVFRHVGSLAEAQRLGDRVSAVLTNEIRLAVGTIWCSGSVGVSWSDDPAMTVEEMVGAADAAMYAAKRARRRTPVLNRKQPQSQVPA